MGWGGGGGFRCITVFSLAEAEAVTIRRKELGILKILHIRQSTLRTNKLKNEDKHMFNCLSLSA